MSHMLVTLNMRHEIDIRKGWGKATNGSSTINFCHDWRILSVKETPLPPPSPPILNGQYLDGIPSRTKWKIHVSSTFSFQDLTVLLIKKITSYSYLFLCFLLFYIRFHISKYHFLRLFRTSFNIIWKKRFSSKYLKRDKRFCRCN